MSNAEEIKVSENEAVSETPTEEKPEAEDKKPKKKAKDGELLAEIEELKKKLAEADDRYLRMAAEYDNFRRRSREEREATYENALSDTVSELLPIIDNLERAALYDDGEKVKEGLVMTLKSAEAVFEKMGVEAFGKSGDTFDPNIHNAVMHTEDENAEENTITQVFQKGFKMGEKIVRFAMVQVAN